MKVPVFVLMDSLIIDVFTESFVIDQGRMMKAASFLLSCKVDSLHGLSHQSVFLIGMLVWLGIRAGASVYLMELPIRVFWTFKALGLILPKPLSLKEERDNYMFNKISCWFSLAAWHGAIGLHCGLTKGSAGLLERVEGRLEGMPNPFLQHGAPAIFGGLKVCVLMTKTNWVKTAKSATLAFETSLLRFLLSLRHLSLLSLSSLLKSIKLALLKEAG